MSHEIPAGSIRSENESDRSDEFKESRGRLIKRVNEWLTELSIKRDEGQPLSDDRTILDSPRLSITDLGPSGPNSRAQIEEGRAGFSLTGDGKERPFILQSLKPADNGTTRIVEATGSDPLAIGLYGQEFTTKRQLEVLSQFGERIVDDTGHTSYFRFSVMGDGHVRQSFISDKGVHTEIPVKDLEGLGMAHTALDQIIASI
jgi:hypothetical protein